MQERSAPRRSFELFDRFYDEEVDKLLDRQLKEENDNEHGKLTHRCGTSRMEVKR